MAYTEEEEILVNVECLNRGLVPTGVNPHTYAHARLNAAFASMSNKDARKAKRKYRKCFRKAVAWKVKNTKDSIDKTMPRRLRRAHEERMVTYVLKSLGLLEENEKSINSTHKYRRRALVIEYLLSAIS